jgi:hypothetical protein
MHAVQEEGPMKAGDHILIPRPGGAEHGIDVGDRTAIVFEPGKGPRRVRLGADGGRPAVVTHVERAYAPKQVVARAFSRFSESAFSAMFGSSEAFAVWCKTGRLPAVVPAPAPAAARAAPAPRRTASAARAAPRKAPKAAARPAASAGRAAAAKPKKAAAKPGKEAASRSAGAGKKRPAEGKRPGASRTAAAKAGDRRKGKPTPKRSAAKPARARARGR